METSLLVIGIWIAGLGLCFYIGSKLTFQIREKKRNQLRIDFERAKAREKKSKL